MRRVGYLLALKVSDGINEQNCAIPGLEFMVSIKILLLKSLFNILHAFLSITVDF